MEDTFIRDYMEDLLRKIRTQVSWGPVPPCIKYVDHASPRCD